MNLFKKPKYLLMILLASFTFVTFVPQFAGAQHVPYMPNEDVIKQAEQRTADAGGKVDPDSVTNWLATQLGHIVYFFTIKLPSLILLLEIKMFKLVGSYNGFTSQAQVKEAWVTVRDLANMFFILILLLMAFGTILQVQGFGYRQLLSKLLLMAILINFSKSIVALLIDFSQIVTLTFLAPVLENLAGNYIVALGLQNIMSLPQEGTGTFTGVTYLMAMILGGIMMIITTVIMGVILIMFVLRIVGFWILIILAPMAFLARAFPKTSSYYGQWEGELSKNLTTGPALAFFLWLAFSIVGQGNISSEFKAETDTTGDNAKASIIDDTADLNITVSKVADTANMLNFVIAITLLMAGLKFAASSGAAGASVAGKASGSLQKWGSRIGRGATIGAAAGVGALAWKGTSGEGGAKGFIGQTSGYAGKGLAVMGGAMGLGGMQRAGLGLQAKESGRRQRKQTKYNKRFEGMSDEQKQEYNKSVGKFSLGRREAQANLAEDQLKTTRGPINPVDAEKMKKRFEAAGDHASIEKLGMRSAATITDAKSFNRMVEKNGPGFLSSLNIKGASQDVINAFMGLSEDVITKAYDGMDKELKKANMEAIDATYDTSPTYTGPKLQGNMANEDSAHYKGRVLQAKYSGKNVENNGMALAYNAMRESEKQAFLKRTKLSGEDMLKINGTGAEGNTMFSDIAGRATQTQVTAMINNLTTDAAGEENLRAITSAQVRAGNIQQMRTVGGGIARKDIQDTDVGHYFNHALPPLPPAGASTVAYDRRKRELTMQNLEHAHIMYPPATMRTPFVAFIEKLSIEQLKKVDEGALRDVRLSCSRDTQDKLKTIGIS
jgi:hypothetical protein